MKRLIGATLIAASILVLAWTISTQESRRIDACAAAVIDYRSHNKIGAINADDRRRARLTCSGVR